ncbi:hypothetical protein [Streptomyces sp. H27-D2]|uniref:hypothetical protein n=1 Tax=Streptomyces sp. H27-D2 TaxID=3046304 RepID=UPI002DBD4C7C|nr:hypothetical protein [Streptomyces sp. H27-D2]MEC4020365.1 hypothetical protein [Streptomyces sp. H27-D2]
MDRFSRAARKLFAIIKDPYADLSDLDRADGANGAPPGAKPSSRTPPRQRNLFEAAACYVAARAEDDEERSAEAASWISPEALMFGVDELACRAVIVLARERGESPREVARALLGLPAA